MPMFGDPSNPSGSEYNRNECVVLNEQYFEEILKATIYNVSVNATRSTNHSLNKRIYNIF